MRRTALVAVAFGVGYLGWLVASGLGPLWVSLPFLVLELWGVLQLGLRASLVWGAVPERELDLTPAGEDRIVDLVVTCTFQTPDELEQTLVSCRSIRGVRRTTVVLQKAHPDLVAVAELFDVEMRVVDGNHVDGFWAAARLSEFVLWLVAGQVAAPGCIEAMVEEFDDADVAFVQADVGLHNTDSFAHVRGGRDEDAFHSRVVQPILGARGAATWKGGGSIVRTSAIADTGGFDGNDQAALQRSAIRMQAAGRISRYSGEPVVVRGAAPDSLGAYLMLRRRSAIELLRVFRTKENPLINKGLTPRQRVDHVALAMGFASSVRQLGLTLVLIAILFTGAVPFAGSAAVWAALWIPFQLASMRANRLLARGTMERGDWTRQAWRTLAADLNALTTVLGLRRRVTMFYRTTGSGFGAIDKMRLATAVLLVLDVAVAARGLTLIWPRILPRFSLSGRIMAIGLGLLAIAVIVDVLQVAVRRKQRRASFRLSTDLVAAVDDQLVHVVDLAVPGFGAHLYASECPFEVGQRVPILLRLPANSGDEQRLEFDGEIRSIVARDDHYRLGVAFGDLPALVRTGLISYCAVGHHELADGYGDAQDLHPAHFEVAAPRGSLVKLCSAVAILTGIGVLFAGPAAPKALADVLSPVSVCLHTSTGKPLEDGQVSFQYDEEWHSIGSTGLTGCIEGKLPATKTRVEIVHRGVRNVIRQNLGETPIVEFFTKPVTVSLQSSGGKPLEGGVAEFRSAGAWQAFGTTGTDGTVTAEILPSKRNFSMWFGGVRSGQQVNLNETSSVAFATVPVSISLRDSRGGVIAGAAAEYRGEDWLQIGQTGDDGTVSTELLPGQVRFGINHEGGRTTIRQNLALDTDVRFSMQPVVVDFRSVDGEPIAGAPVEVSGNGWRNVGDTDDAGSLVVDVLPQNRSFRITHDGLRHRIRQDVALDPNIRFSTQSTVVRLQDSTGQPLVGYEVEARAGGWNSLGETNADGEVVGEFLPARIRFRTVHEGERQSVRGDARTVATVVFEIMVDDEPEAFEESDEPAEEDAERDSGDELVDPETSTTTIDNSSSTTTESSPTTTGVPVVAPATTSVAESSTSAAPSASTSTSTSTSTTEAVTSTSLGSTTTGSTPNSSTTTALTNSTTTAPVASSTSTSSTALSGPATTAANATASTTTQPASTTTQPASTTTQPASTTTSGPARVLSAPSTTPTEGAPEREQAVAARTVLAEPGKLFESETVATALTWSSPDLENLRLLDVTLEDASIYDSFGGESTVGYAFRFDNSSDVDIADGAVIELQIPGALGLVPESADGWECADSGETWRCVRTAAFPADASSTIRVAATLPAPEVVAFEPRNSMTDLVAFGATVAALLGLLYFGTLQIDRRRTS